MADSIACEVMVGSVTADGELEEKSSGIPEIRLETITCVI